MDADHDPALADGGPDDAAHITPRAAAEHFERHMSNGDFARWGMKSQYETQMNNMMNEELPNVQSRNYRFR